MAKAGSKHLTEKRFNEIKSMLNTGIEPGQLAKIIPESLSTVHRVNDRSSFAEHKAWQKAERQKYLAKRNKSVTVDAVMQQTMDIIDNADKAVPLKTVQSPELVELKMLNATLLDVVRLMTETNRKLDKIINPTFETVKPVVKKGLFR